MFKTMPYPRVELAVLGNQAGIIGAAMLAKSIIEEGRILCQCLKSLIFTNTRPRRARS